MTSTEIDALFAMAEMARKQADVEHGEDDIDEDDDSNSLFVNPMVTSMRTGRPRYVALPDGDYHLCFGTQCRHVELDSKERQWYCTITGNVVGVEHSRDYDAGWTGRSTGSANPDDTAGTPIGGWVKRRDMYKASVEAWQMAQSFSDADVRDHDPPRAPRPAERASAKRGALCVDEPSLAETAGTAGTATTPQQQQQQQSMPLSPGQAKRQRVCKRDAWTRDAVEKLMAEAGVVIDKLFIVDEQTTTAAAAAVAASSSVSSTTPPPENHRPDPRLQNLEFVRSAAVRKYVRACIDNAQRLNLDVLHNVCVHANDFVRQQRTRATVSVVNVNASASRASTTRVSLKNRACSSGQVRNLVAGLIVSLWRAACLTPHMRDNRKGNDSFRPFAAGVLYSFKRGIYLSDGTCVVPALETLAQHLPALRSAHSTPQAKQLQSSSHRGICSFHRSIASIEHMTAEDAAAVRQLLSNAARATANLREIVHRIDQEGKT